MSAPDFVTYRGPGGVEVTMLAPHLQAEPMTSPPVPGMPAGYRLAYWRDGIVGLIPAGADEATTRAFYGFARMCLTLMEGARDAG